MSARERQDIGRCCRCLASLRGSTAVKSVMTKTPKPLADWLHIELQSRTEGAGACKGGRVRRRGSDRQTWNRERVVNGSRLTGRTSGTRER